MLHNYKYNDNIKIYHLRQNVSNCCKGGEWYGCKDSSKSAKYRISDVEE